MQNSRGDNVGISSHSCNNDCCLQRVRNIWYICSLSLLTSMCFSCKNNSFAYYVIFRMIKIFCVLHSTISSFLSPNCYIRQTIRLRKLQLKFVLQIIFFFSLAIINQYVYLKVSLLTSPFLPEFSNFSRLSILSARGKNRVAASVLHPKQRVFKR